MAMISQAMRKIEMMYKLKPFVRISFRLLWTNLINFRKKSVDKMAVREKERERSNLVMRRKKNRAISFMFGRVVE